LDRVVENVKPHVLRLINFSWKSCRWCENEKKNLEQSDRPQCALDVG